MGKTSAMTTKQRQEMMKYVNENGSGIILRSKLEAAYKAGFSAREAEIEELRRQISGEPKKEWQDV